MSKSEASQFYQRACVGYYKMLESGNPYTRNCVESYSKMLDEMKRHSETENASVSDAEL